MRLSWVADSAKGMTEVDMAKSPWGALPRLDVIALARCVTPPPELLTASGPDVEAETIGHKVGV
jgi:hypothetical protein